MRRAVPAVALLLALSMSASVWAGWAKPKRLVVRGQVTEESGAGVEGIPIRVLATRRVVKFLTIESQPAEKELVSTVSGANGFYELEVPKVRDHDFYFLRFHDAHFDAVRYSTPPDIEITGWINKRRPVVQDVRLTSAPGWDAVRRLVDLYGADTTRGKIIRQLGVPERTERTSRLDDLDRETWWYEILGVAYVIEDGEVVEKRSFQPRQESRPLARR